MSGATECASPMEEGPSPIEEFPAHLYEELKMNYLNVVTNASSAGDSDYEYRKQHGYCLSSQRKPVANLKYVLTCWYSPETSLAIAECISASYPEVELQKILSSSSRELLELSRKYFTELRI